LYETEFFTITIKIVKQIPKYMAHSTCSQ